MPNRPPRFRMRMIVPFCIALLIFAYIAIYSIHQAPISFAPDSTAPSEDAVAPLKPAHTNQDEIPAFLSESTRSKPHSINIQVSMNGAPVAQAEIAYLPWSPTVERAAKSDNGIPLSTASTAVRLRTDEMGRAKLEAQDLPIVVAARAESTQLEAVIVDHATNELTIELSVDSPVRVKVLNSSGAPIAGAKIRACEDPKGSLSVDPRASLARHAARRLFSSTAETGSNGSATIRGLGRGMAAVIATADGFGADGSSSVSLPFAGELIFVLEGACSIRGTVLEEATKSPIENARVSIDRFRGDQSQGSSGVIYTDQAGRFDLSPTLAGYETNYLLITSDDFATEVLDLGRLDVGDSKDILILMSKSTSIRGRVVDSSGEGIGGAGVWTSKLESRYYIDHQLTDANGQFTLDVVKANGTFGLASTAPGFGVAETRIQPPWPSELSITLHALSTLRGRLVCDHLPIHNARVRASMEALAFTRTVEVSADADPESGTFEIVGLAPGQYFVDAFVEGYAPTRIAAVEVQEHGTPDVEIHLDRGATVFGRITSERTGEPVVGAKLHLIDPAMNSRAFVHHFDRETISNDDGIYTFENVPRGASTGFFVSADSYARTSVLMEIDEQATTIRRDIKLSTPVSLSMTLRRPDGVFAQEFRAWIKDSTGGTQVVSAQAGIASIGSCPPGMLKVDMLLLDRDRPEFYLLEATRTESISEQETSLTIDLAQGGQLYGRLIAAPEILAGRHFSLSAVLLPNLDRHVGSARRLPDGRFYLAGLEPGEWLIRLQSSSAGPNVGAERTHVIEEGITYELDFQVGTAFLTGVLRDSAGSPIGGGHISIRLHTTDQIPPTTVLGDSWHRDISKPDGSFRVEGLFPGTQEFWVDARGYGRLEGEITEISLEKPNIHDFVLEPDCTVRVAVTDLTDRRIENASVELRRLGSSSEPLRPSQVDARDRMIIRGASTGQHTLSVRAVGFFPFETVIHCVAGEDITANAQLRRPGHLAIRLKDTQGTLLRDTPVEVIDSNTNQSIGAWIESGLVTTTTGVLATDEHGEIRISGIPVGTYVIHCLGSTLTLPTVAADASAELFLVTR